MFRSRKSSVVAPPAEISPTTLVVPRETPAQMKARELAALEVARARDTYADEQRVRAQRIEDENRARAQKLADEAEHVQKTSKAVKSTEEIAARQRRNAALVNYAPLVVISALAISGQYGYLKDALAETFGKDTFLTYAVAVLSAGALESITLFLGYHAMLAMRRRDSAAGLVLASIVLGSIVAFMNYSHFAPVDVHGNVNLGAPTSTAVIFGIFSFLNPFLWRVKIRSEHRDELSKNGEIEKRGLKLPRVMWLHHPVQAYKVTRHAAWTGERVPELAVRQWECARMLNEPLKEAREVDLIHAEAEIMDLQKELANLRWHFESETSVQRVKYEVQITDLQSELGSIRDEFLAIRQAERVTYEETLEELTSELQSVRDALTRVKVERIDRPAREKRPVLESGDNPYAKHMQHKQWDEGVAIYNASADNGTPMNTVQLADALQMKNRVLPTAIVNYCREDRQRREHDRHASALVTEAPATA